MAFIWYLFLIAAIGLVGWSLFTFYNAQPKDQSKARRAMGALWAGIMAAAAWLAAFFQSPPPAN